MATYGQSIRWTKYSGRSVSIVKVCGRESAEKARKDAVESALHYGWTPVKWWQWWRKNDTKIDLEES